MVSHVWIPTNKGDVDTMTMIVMQSDMTIMVLSEDKM